MCVLNNFLFLCSLFVLKCSLVRVTKVMIKKRLLEIARKEKNIVSLIVLVFGLVSLKVTQNST